MTQMFLFPLLLLPLLDCSDGLSLINSKGFTLHYYPNVSCPQGPTDDEASNGTPHVRWTCCADSCVRSPSGKATFSLWEESQGEVLTQYEDGLCTINLDFDNCHDFKIFVYGGLPPNCTRGSLQLNAVRSHNFNMIITDDSYRHAILCNATVGFRYSRDYSVYFESRAVCSSDFPVITSDHSHNYYITFHSPEGPTNRDGRGCSSTALPCYLSHNFTVDYVGGSTNCTSQKVFGPRSCNSFSINYKTRDTCIAAIRDPPGPGKLSAYNSKDFVINYEVDRRLMCQEQEAISVSYSERFAVIYIVSHDSCSSVSNPNVTNTSYEVQYSCHKWTNLIPYSIRNLKVYQPSCQVAAQVSVSSAKFYDSSVKNGVCSRDKFLQTDVRSSSSFEVHYYLDGSSPETPFDECKAGLHTCTSRQKCNDVLNGYYCSCKPGFYPTSPTSCRRLQCPQLEDPWIPSVKVERKKSRSRTAFYSCPNGYKLVGNEKRVCRLGTWTGMQPICVPFDLNSIL